MSKQSKFLRCMQAMQAFGGKPLKALDAADFTTDEQMDAMDSALRAMAEQLRTEDRTDWPELHTLADEIVRCLDRPYREIVRYLDRPD